MRTIEVVVDPAGGLKIEAVNFQGADCEKATRFLEEALGEIQNRTHKPAYLARARTKANQQVRR
jgi:hypothetical protein